MFKFKVNVTMVTFVVESEKDSFNITTALFQGRQPMKITTPALTEVHHTNVTELKHEYINVPCVGTWETSLQDAIKESLQNENITYNEVIDLDEKEDNKNA